MSSRKRLYALVYDRQMRGTERAGLGALRADLLSHAAGRVLEVGAGTGANLPFFGAATDTLTLTEPEPPMVARLQRRVAAQPRAVTVLRAPAEDLPFEAGQFDTVVCTLVLCGVADQPRAVREMRRVLRPGGTLLFLEHLRADDARLARRQDRLNWLSRAVGQCDCNRPTLDTIRRAGFTLEHLDLGELPKSPSFVRPLAVGRATSPAHDLAERH